MEGSITIFLGIAIAIMVAYTYTSLLDLTVLSAKREKRDKAKGEEYGKINTDITRTEFLFGIGTGTLLIVLAIFLRLQYALRLGIGLAGIYLLLSAITWNWSSLNDKERVAVSVGSLVVLTVTAARLKK